MWIKTQYERAINTEKIKCFNYEGTDIINIKDEDRNFIINEDIKKYNL